MNSEYEIVLDHRLALVFSQPPFVLKEGDCKMFLQKSPNFKACQMMLQTKSGDETLISFIAFFNVFVMFRLNSCAQRYSESSVHSIFLEKS